MSALSLPSLGGPDEPDQRLRGAQPEITWGEIAQRAPLMVSTMATYLDQLSVSARPGTVAAFEIALRFFAGRVTEADRWCVCVADIERRHIEDFKLWQAKRPGKHGKKFSTTTIRHRLGLLRTFFERIIEWGYDDAPARVPIFPGDFPKADEPLPKFLDDRTMAKFMAAVAKDTNPRRRLMMELLARTGMRVGELASLEDDAMVQISETFWLRIPVGKLHNDRYVPLHPILVDLITDYRKSSGPNRSGRLVVRERRPALRPADGLSLCRVDGQASGHRTRPPAPAPPHLGDPSDQPRHEPRGHRRTARPPVDADDHDLCPDLRPHRRRRVLPGDRGGRGQLRTHRGTPGHGSRGQHAEAGSRPPAHARQRDVHPARRPRLLIRVSL